MCDGIEVLTLHQMVFKRYYYVVPTNTYKQCFENNSNSIAAKFFIQSNISEGVKQTF